MKYYTDNKILSNRLRDRVIKLLNNSYDLSVDFFFLNNIEYLSMSNLAIVRLITRYRHVIDLSDDEIAEYMSNELDNIKTLFTINTPDTLIKSSSLLGNSEETWIMDSSIYGLTKASIEWQSYDSLKLLDHSSVDINFLPQTVCYRTNDLIGLVNISKLMLQYKYFHLANEIHNRPVHFVGRYLLPKLVKDYTNIAILNRFIFRTGNVNYPVSTNKQSGLNLPNYVIPLNDYINEVIKTISAVKFLPGNVFNNIELLDQNALNHFNITLPPEIAYDVYEIIFDMKAYALAYSFNNTHDLNAYKALKDDLIRAYAYYVKPKKNLIHENLLRHHLENLK